MDCKSRGPINISLLLLLLLLILFGEPVRCYLSEIVKMSRRLDELFHGFENSKKSNENFESDSKIWQRYEFDTGVGNRDELSITNITTRIDPELSNYTVNYQFIAGDDEYFLAGFNDRSFYLCKLDLTQERTIYRLNVNSHEKIQNFKIFAVPNTSRIESKVITTILVVVCVKSVRGTDMLWYRFTGDKLAHFETLPIQRNVENLQFFHYQGQNRLLILREEARLFDKTFSPIDIYAFNIIDEHPNLWLTQRLNVRKTFEIHVCPSHESTIIALRCKNDVVIYEYMGDENEEGLFVEHQTLRSNNLQNLICFESGYARYLVTSGPEAAIFNFFETEFHHDTFSDHIFNDIGEVSWIDSMPVNNYRKDSLLLVQLKNSTMIALTWKGRGFEKTSLPNVELDNLDLSRITIIPKYGFVYENKLVKIDTSLSERTWPVRDEMEKLLRTKYGLAEVLQKQELVLDETEARTYQTYFTNHRIKDFSNFSKIEAKTLTINGEAVSCDEIAIGTKKISLDDFLSDQMEIKKHIDDLESKIHEIKSNLADSVSRDTDEIILNDNLFVDGNFHVRGTMSMYNLTFDNLNGFSRDEIIRDLAKHDEKSMIHGEKIFESIEANNLNVSFINGVPMDEIKFNSIKRDYGNVDFGKLRKLKIEGNLNFTSVNGVNWEKLMKKVIFKGRSTIIPGTTIVEGDLVTEKIEIERLNGLLYPEEYISSKNRDPVMVTGKKKFDKLTMSSLDVDPIETINGVSIHEYVTLNGDRNLTHETTFENLTITESFQMDGKFGGLSDAQRLNGLTLNKTMNVTGDVIFEKLRVTGNFEVEDSLNGTNWSELDDLVSIDDEEIVITGEKIFLTNVEVNSELVIEKRTINGHSIDEFVTLDTEQEFPNLTKISGNVTFVSVKREDMENMKNLLTENLKKSNDACLSKVLIFNAAPTVDRLFYAILNKNITPFDFMASTNRTFGNVNFQNLETTNLHAREIVPTRVNNENYEEFRRTRISMTESQVIDGNYEIDILSTNLLKILTIDGLTLNEMENLRISLNNYYDEITNGNVTIEDLTIKGDVRATSVNGKLLKNLRAPETMGSVIFRKDVYVKNLFVDGSINEINFMNFVNDSVMKNDRDVIFTGKKKLEKVRCETLKASRINGKSVDDILDPKKHQILSGSITINGTVKVLDRFETNEKIGELTWQRISERLNCMGNDTYSLNGDVVFTSDKAIVENLDATGAIQGINFTDFLRSVVHKNSKNVTIRGPVVFRDPVTIDSSLIVTENFNDLNVKYFYDHAVRIDRPFDVKSTIIFTENIVIEKDLMVDEELEAKKIGGVDLKEIYESAVFVDRPTAITGSVTLGNVIFESDIEFETLNDIDLRDVVTLEGEQTIGGTLRCGNITVDKLEIGGSVNDRDLKIIYDDTFMLNGNQSISSHVVFDGNVIVRRNFDAKLVNGIDPKKIISLEGNDTLIGNFIFEQPLVVHGNLSTRGAINGIDLTNWKARYVAKSFPTRQIVRGDWIVHGNVYFAKNIYGNEFLDGVNVTKFSDYLLKRDIEMELKIKNVKVVHLKDLQSFCKDLSILKAAADNRVYKYEYFDYLQVLNFDRTIVSVHRYETKNNDYLLMNFDNCQLNIYVFTDGKFIAHTNLSNVGYIERWLTLRYDEQIYFLTVGKSACEKNAGNLWKIHDNRFIHVHDLGDVTDARKINDNEFLIIIDDKMIRRSIVEFPRSSSSMEKSYEIDGDNLKFVADSDELLLVDNETIYEYKFSNDTENRRMRNLFGTRNILSFRLGIYEREIFIHHDDSISEEYLFITENNLQRNKILQAIRAQRPSSIIVLKFDGLIENFLIFLEDHRILQIYEYRGIEGFVYRESIRIKAEKIFTFKIRKYPRLARKHCVAAIQEKRLVLMEAKMYGERLDMGELTCN